MLTGMSVGLNARRELNYWALIQLGKLAEPASTSTRNGVPTPSSTSGGSRCGDRKKMDAERNPQTDDELRRNLPACAIKHLARRTSC